MVAQSVKEHVDNMEYKRRQDAGYGGLWASRWQANQGTVAAAMARR